MNGVIVIAAAAVTLVFGNVVPVQAGTWLRSGGETSKPYGHHAYCQKRPADCGATAKADPEKLTSGRLGTMKSVNNAVNRAIKPAADRDIYGKEEVWALGVRRGDCEDYALAKRQQLRARGFKLSNLRLAMVRQRSGEAHTVLVVRTDKGDYVLDNLRNDVLLWNRTGYRFVKMQSGTNAAQWVTTR